MSQLNMQLLPNPKNNKLKPKLLNLDTNQEKNKVLLSSVNFNQEKKSTNLNVFSIYSCKGLSKMIKDFNSIPKGCKSCGH